MKRPERARSTRIAAFVLMTTTLSAEARAEPTFGLAFAIARNDDGTKIADDAWIRAQIEDANRLFVPLGARFRWTIDKALAEPLGEVHTRAERDALTPLTEANAIDVFVVRALEDVDEPGRARMGVCWTGRGGKRFIVLSRIARATVLAHELGHFFGNAHSPVVDNVMSYARSGGSVFFDARQATTIASYTQRFLDVGRLIDVGPPRRAF